jgi:hypothetical protein
MTHMQSQSKILNELMKIQSYEATPKLRINSQDDDPCLNLSQDSLNDTLLSRELFPQDSQARLGLGFVA